MQLTLCLPTRNRSALWKQGLIWQALCNQTDLDFSAIVVNDASTDDTDAIVSKLMADAPFPCKLFRVIEPRPAEWQVSPVSDNVAFREATGDIIVHMDDDCILHHELVLAIKHMHAAEFNAIYYGCIAYCDPVTRVPIKPDDRMVQFAQGKVWKLPFGGDHHYAYGAVYSAPLKLIREIGGHEVSKVVKNYYYDGTGFKTEMRVMATLRGADSRLGWQMQNKMPAYFCNIEALTFEHVGYSGYHKALEQGLESLFDRHRYGPARSPSQKPDPTSNGGPEFWGSKFPIKYDLVFQKA